MQLYLYRDTRRGKRALYQGGKNHAVPVSHRDRILAKDQTGLDPGASSGNTNALYCRAVRHHTEPPLTI